MFKIISQKWNTSLSLVKTAFFYISRDGELFWYGVLSFVISLVGFVGIIFFLYYFNGTIESTLDQLETNSTQMILLGAGFVYYLFFALVKYFFQAAIMSSIERRLEGKDNSFGDGISSAFSHFSKIFLWSLVESTVFSIINSIQKRFGENSIFSKFLAKILGGAWEILTYFAFPLLMLTSKGIKDSINESGKLFTKTWGERAMVFVGTGFVFFTITFPIILLGGFMVIFFIIHQSVLMAAITFFVMLFIVQIIHVVANVCESIIKVLLLYYAITGKIPERLETTNIAKIRNEDIKIL